MSSSDSEFELAPESPMSPERLWDVIDPIDQVIHCTVCQHTDAEKNFVTPEKCTHVFHIECVGKFRNCPMCRVPLDPFQFYL